MSRTQTYLEGITRVCSEVRDKKKINKYIPDVTRNNLFTGGPQNRTRTGTEDIDGAYAQDYEQNPGSSNTTLSGTVSMTERHDLNSHLPTSPHPQTPQEFPPAKGPHSISPPASSALGSSEASDEDSELEPSDSCSRSGRAHV